MFRPASRLIARSSGVVRVQVPNATPTTRRFLNTAPPSQRSRSWKNLVARIGLAGAVIYFYNTTEVFAEEPRHLVHQVAETNEETEQLPTIEALARERQQRKDDAKRAQVETGEGEGGVQEPEEEAGQQGAFNPETGEINWDCPCLGGMATGPCGEQFKAAFSCFMFSEADPKGMDCVDKFKDMQNCFREYPEVYGSELEPDEDDDVTGDDDKDLAALEETPESAPSEKLEESKLAAERRQQKQHEPQKDQSRDVTEQRKKEQALSGSDQVIPQAAHDDKTTNEGKKVDQEKKFNEVKEQ